MEKTSSSDGNNDSEPSLLRYAFVALGIALIVRFFIAAPYVVSGASMEPTFHDWDYLITDRLSYRLKEPERGDVVIFTIPDSSEKTLIKRVIGLPGETVSVDGTRVVITNDAHPEGFELTESYLDPKNLNTSLMRTLSLGANEYFVLGDNREVSSDSRIWGALPGNLIVGRVLVRLFPFTMLGVFPGKERYQE